MGLANPNPNPNPNPSPIQWSTHPAVAPGGATMHSYPGRLEGVHVLGAEAGGAPAGSLGAGGADGEGSAAPLTVTV